MLRGGGVAGRRRLRVDDDGGDDGGDERPLFVDIGANVGGFVVQRPIWDAVPVLLPVHRPLTRVRRVRAGWFALNAAAAGGRVAAFEGAGPHVRALVGVSARM